MSQYAPRHAVFAAAIATLFASSSMAQQAPTADLSLDSLLNTRISAASKYQQASSAAPGSVTIVTAEDIRNHGYRNFQEILESVRGFYVSNDRNFSYLGTRGFGRPSEQNNRVLLLVDGHPMNEPVFGSAPLGTLPLNLNAVERVEIVQGPGSALYGTSAMFAVINIVTKSGIALDGGSVQAGVGSAGERVASGMGGRALGARGSIAGSAMISRIAGNDQFYQEFNHPETSNGIAHDLDWEHEVSALGSATWADLSTRAGFESRDKGVPTGHYGVVFGDTRAMSADRDVWGDVTLRHEWSGTLSASSKLYASQEQQRGVYPFVANVPAYLDFIDDTSVGVENLVMWEPSSRDRLTVGTDVKRVLRASYADKNPDGTGTADNKPFSVLSAFAQNEFQLLPSATLVAGMRVDRYSSLGSAATPRLALLLTPDNVSTIKLLYGEAFRAPSAAEALLTAGALTANPNLKPERVRTTEIDLQRRMGNPVLVGLSLYHYRITDLIDRGVVGRTVLYSNLSEAVGEGAEAELDLRPSGPVAMHMTFALQHAEDSTGVSLTNSPREVGNASITGHTGTGLRGAVQLRYESGRKTLTGMSTSAFTRVDTNVGYAVPETFGSAWMSRSELSLRITNLFNVAYSTPTGPGLVQSAIFADGRTLALRLDVRL